MSDPMEILTEIEKTVKREFPHKFVNQNKQHAPSVDSSRGSSRKSNNDEIELTDMERKIMNTLINQKGKDGKPLITKEQYLADLKSAKAR